MRSAVTTPEIPVQTLPASPRSTPRSAPARASRLSVGCPAEFPPRTQVALRPVQGQAEAIGHHSQGARVRECCIAADNGSRRLVEGRGGRFKLGVEGRVVPVLKLDRLAIPRALRALFRERQEEQVIAEGRFGRRAVLVLLPVEVE